MAASILCASGALEMIWKNSATFFDHFPFQSHIRLSSLRVTSSDNCTFIEEEIGSFVGPISLGCEIPFDPG